MDTHWDYHDLLALDGAGDLEDDWYDRDSSSSSEGELVVDDDGNLVPAVDHSDLEGAEEGQDSFYTYQPPHPFEPRCGMARPSTIQRYNLALKAASWRSQSQQSWQWAKAAPESFHLEGSFFA